MSFSQAMIKDSLRRIEAKVDMLVEQTKDKSTVTVPQVIDNQLTEMQKKMERVRAARGKNTGRE